MISVIIIGYNIEKYIIRCIESIVNQSYKNFEIIYVDDGSTDNTYQIILDYKNNNNIENLFLYKKKNEGCLKARLYGLKSAKGNFVTFFDGDDYIYPNCLNDMINSINGSDVDISSFSYNTLDKNDKTIYTNIARNTGIRLLNDYDYLYNIISDNIYHSIDPRIYVTEFLNKIDFSHVPNVCLAEDLCFSVMCALNKPKVTFNNSFVSAYCYNKDSVTKDVNQNKYYDYIYVVQFLSMLINNHNDLKYKKTITSILWLKLLWTLLSDYEILPENKNKYLNFLRFNNCLIKININSLDFFDKKLRFKAIIFNQLIISNSRFIISFFNFIIFYRKLKNFIYLL